MRKACKKCAFEKILYEYGSPRLANLEIYLFGAPEIYCGGERITGLPTKTEALLCYLAVTRQIHLRASLASLLWGELPEKNARANLRKAIQPLRFLCGIIIALAIAVDERTRYNEPIIR